MKPMPDQNLERMRQLASEIEILGESPIGTANGIFMTRYEGAILRIIASQDPDWEHVSISLQNRCPTWREMCFVKDLFWEPDECVMQLHPPRDQWVNNHRFCLHLWKPIGREIPMPPAVYVGVKGAGVIRTDADARRALALVEEELSR